MEAHLQITIKGINQMQSDILVAELDALGFEGFEESENRLDAFIPGDQFSKEALDQIMLRYGLNYGKSLLPRQNWNESWEKNFDPVVVNKYCAIRSAFHEPVRDAKFEIIITPKMSFGTGHHATTSMMIEAMEKLRFENKDVLDFGTGTGILAILAEKAGARSVHAIDHDEWSIKNARENFAVNACHCVHLEHAGRLPPGRIFDFILANISKSVIFNNLTSFQQHLAKDGVLLLSGLLSEDLSELKNEVGNCALDILERSDRKNWICVKLIKA